MLRGKTTQRGEDETREGSKEQGGREVKVTVISFTISIDIYITVEARETFLADPVTTRELQTVLHLPFNIHFPFFYLSGFKVGKPSYATLSDSVTY